MRQELWPRYRLSCTPFPARTYVWVSDNPKPASRAAHTYTPPPPITHAQVLLSAWACRQDPHACKRGAEVTDRGHVLKRCVATPHGTIHSPLDGCATKHTLSGVLKDR